MINAVEAIAAVIPIRPVRSLAVAYAMQVTAPVSFVYESPAGERYARDPSRARLRQQMTMRRLTAPHF